MQLHAVLNGIFNQRKIPLRCINDAQSPGVKTGNGFGRDMGFKLTYPLRTDDFKTGGAM